MAYYGRVKVTVELLRQGRGVDGGEFGVEQEAEIEVEVHHARALADELTSDDGRAALGELSTQARAVASAFVAALKRTLDADEMADMQQRWTTEIERMTPDRMRRALAELERPEPA